MPTASGATPRRRRPGPRRSRRPPRRPRSPPPPTPLRCVRFQPTISMAAPFSTGRHVSWTGDSMARRSPAPFSRAPPSRAPSPPQQTGKLTFRSATAGCGAGYAQSRCVTSGYFYASDSAGAREAPGLMSAGSDTRPRAACLPPLLLLVARPSTRPPSSSFLHHANPRNCIAKRTAGDISMLTGCPDCTDCTDLLGAVTAGDLNSGSMTLFDGDGNLCAQRRAALLSARNIQVACCSCPVIARGFTAGCCCCAPHARLVLAAPPVARVCAAADALRPPPPPPPTRLLRRTPRPQLQRLLHALHRHHQHLNLQHNLDAQPERRRRRPGGQRRAVRLLLRVPCHVPARPGNVVLHGGPLLPDQPLVLRGARDRIMLPMRARLVLLGCGCCLLHSFDPHSLQVAVLDHPLPLVPI